MFLAKNVLKAIKNVHEKRKNHLINWFDNISFRKNRASSLIRMLRNWPH